MSLFFVCLYVGLAVTQSHSLAGLVCWLYALSVSVSVISVTVATVRWSLVLLSADRILVSVSRQALC